MNTLVGSKDRKVANAVNSTGKTAVMSNTFGLVSGKAYSCPGATSYCEKICYAGKLEKIFKGVRETMVRNFEILSTATLAEMVSMIDRLIADFVAECDKRDADKVYRIHWDGDFFNKRYTLAWQHVISNHPDVQFWVYTRNVEAAVILHKAGLSNLSLFFSVDPVNAAAGKVLNKTYGIRIAAVADTFAESQALVKDITGKPGAKCPEQTGQIPLISTRGSACVTCGLCVEGKANISFSRSKK